MSVLERTSTVHVDRCGVPTSSHSCRESDEVALLKVLIAASGQATCETTSMCTRHSEAQLSKDVFGSTPTDDTTVCL